MWTALRRSRTFAAQFRTRSHEEDEDEDEDEASGEKIEGVSFPLGLSRRLEEEFWRLPLTR